MEDAEEFCIEEEAEDEENEGEKKQRPIIKNAMDLQRLKLEKLMKNPDKPIIIPEIPKEKDFMQTVPTFVRNVMGSSAGAGSGEFHVYRHLRRKEYARQKYIQAKSIREQLDDEYRQKLEQNRKDAEEKTAKRRAKRLKKKQKMKQKGRKRRKTNETDDHHLNSEDANNTNESSEESENEEKKDEANIINNDDKNKESGENKKIENEEEQQNAQPSDDKDETVHLQDDKEKINGSNVSIGENDVNISKKVEEVIGSSEEKTEDINLGVETNEETQVKSAEKEPDKNEIVVNS